tara:strand:- start:482 stop:751 length:270 start_codon:yes stop_codon:yes gene_type:complete
METKCTLSGVAIVVVDRGFVYVGDVDIDADWCIINNARNIRKWGTTKGLGQLALDGPTNETVLDAVGTVRVPLRAVVSVIDTQQLLWPK